MESIRFKLWTTIIALVFIILTPIWYFQVISLADNFSIAQRNETHGVIEKLSGDLEKYDFTPQFETVAFDAASQLEYCVFVYEADNFIFDSGGIKQAFPVYSASKYSDCGLEVLVAQDQINFLTHVKINAGSVSLLQPTTKEEYPSYIYGEQVTTATDSYLLVVSSYVVPVNRMLRLLKQQLMLLTLPVVIGASVLAFFIARSFSKPITKLSVATKEMAMGKYETRVKVDCDDEIGVLQENFNHMAEEISHLEEMRRDLIANVSHDLRTPLTMIRGYAETIKDLTGDIKEKRDAQLDVIIEESERLNALVSDILNLSRMQSNQISMTPTKIDLGVMIRGTLDQYALLQDHQGYIFNYEPLSEEAYVYADALRIKQVLYNILNNAINHTGEDKKITIRLIKKQEKYRVEISDTGHGIAKEELPRIWDRYYKIDKSGKRRMAGTGIGLSIVKTILSSHEALFGVESEVGNGATFWFELKRINGEK